MWEFGKRYFSLDGRIEGVTILEHKEDPTTLPQIEKGWFLKQFAGKRSDNALEVGKDIQAVSEATVTAQAIARSLKNTLERFGQLEKLAEEGLPAVEAEVAQKTENKELAEKERNLTRMFKENNLSLTPARYYRNLSRSK